MPYIDSIVFIVNAYKSLHFGINVLLAFSSVGDGVMSNIVNVVLAKEVYSEHPWAWHNDFIDPFAVLEYL